MKWGVITVMALGLGACSKPPPDRTAELHALQAQVDSLTAELNKAKDEAAHPTVAAELIVNDGKESYRREYASAVTGEEARKAVAGEFQEREAKAAATRETARQAGVVELYSTTTPPEALCIDR